MGSALKRILLAEDNANDVELTLTALRANSLANEVIVVRDGAEALDYLHRRGAFADREPGLPALMLLDLKMPKVDGLEVLRLVKEDPELANAAGRRAHLVARRAGPRAELRSRRQRVRREAGRFLRVHGRRQAARRFLGAVERASAGDGASVLA